MRASLLLAGAALAMTSAWAIAQDAPESLLPPGFDNPAPAPAPAPSRASPPAGGGAGPAMVPGQVVQPLPAGAAGPALANETPEQTGAGATFSRIPSLEELARMTPEDFEAILNSSKAFAIPAGAHRSMAQAGLLAEDEGGLEPGNFAGQNPRLVRLAINANRGELTSRWGHILLRRALASRLPAPRTMTPQEFLALRVGLLSRMGEADAARAVLQDVDSGDYTPALGQAAFDIYAHTADFTGLCSTLIGPGGTGEGGQWNAARAICSAFRGNGMSALSQLDKELYRGSMPRIDLLLAQKYAGAAGKARRAVTIEWDGVADMTPWRYGLALGVGLEPPKPLMDGTGGRFDAMTALAPMAPLASRAAAADRAGAIGVLSSAAMVDLYSQLYADPDVTADWSDRTTALRDAYVAESPAARLAAMQGLWSGAADARIRYGRQVLTAYAAARMVPSADLADAAAPLIASMLSAGFDANALRWNGVVGAGTEAWGLLALAAPRGAGVDTGALDTFVDGDDSDERRKSAFLVAGLAGLGRIDEGTASRYSQDLGLNLGTASVWSQAIESAADHGDPVTVVLLAGLGLQGRDLSRIKPRYLYHVVSALRRAGFEAEARMIAAEAVARA